MKNHITKHLLITLIVLFIPFGISAIEPNKTQCQAFVLVSIAPHKYFIERIAGDKVSVGVMVPPGANAHTFEPSPRQVIRYSCAQTWFLIGESFEKKFSQAMKAHHPDLAFVDLRQGIDMIHDTCHHCCTHHDCADPHTWLSVRAAKQQANTILSQLIKTYPQHSKEFTENYQLFIQDLEALDKEIAQLLEPVKGRSFIVSHPAYGYFARDYGLEQLSIEFEGKDPSPKQLTRTLQLAKEKEIKTIFIQVQFNNKGARLVAQQIGADIKTLDPYGENYIENMRETAKALANP